MVDVTKLPRIYVPNDLGEAQDVILEADQSHYLINVMRKNTGDKVRVFNGRDGEFIATIMQAHKKSTCLGYLKNIKAQPQINHKIHLYCAPIKKDRMAFMIEKAVELGVTDIHPIISERTQHGKINFDKTERHMIEAAEQCERLDIPTLHDMQKIDRVNFACETFAAIERADDTDVFAIQNQKNDVAILIGPEGGWSESEIAFLTAHPKIIPVSLGDIILRAETAAIFMLSRIDK